MTAVTTPLRRVALVSFGGIGDTILFSPVIEALCAALPDAHFTLLLEDRSQSVAPLLAGVSEVVPIAVQGVPRSRLFLTLLKILRAGRYDAVVATGSSPAIALLLALTGIPVRVGFYSGFLSHVLLSAVAPLRKYQYAGAMYAALSEVFVQKILHQKPVVPAGPLVPHLAAIPEAKTQWAQTLLKQEAERPLVLIHPGVSRVSVQKNILKSWPVTSWATLIMQLIERNHRVVLVGGPDDAEAVAGIARLLPERLAGFENRYGETKSLTDLAALIQQADCLVAADSSPLHIAVGLGTPVVAMFGPTDEKKLLPGAADRRFQAVTVAALPCRPCLWDIRQTSCDAPVCLDVPVEAMLSAVLRNLPESCPSI